MRGMAGCNVPVVLETVSACFLQIVCSCILCSCILFYASLTFWSFMQVLIKPFSKSAWSQCNAILKASSIFWLIYTPLFVDEDLLWGMVGENVIAFDTVCNLSSRCHNHMSVQALSSWPQFCPTLRRPCSLIKFIQASANVLSWFNSGKAQSGQSGTFQFIIQYKISNQNCLLW